MLGYACQLGSKQQLEHTRDILVREQFIQRIQLKSKVQNIVATAAVRGNIDLNLAASTLSKLMFEPEQSPGAIYRTPEGPVCLIFGSGKIVITGAKSELSFGNYRTTRPELWLNKFTGHTKVSFILQAPFDICYKRAKNKPEYADKSEEQFKVPYYGFKFLCLFNVFNQYYS